MSVAASPPSPVRNAPSRLRSSFRRMSSSLMRFRLTCMSSFRRSGSLGLHTASCALKNHGVAQARADLIAILDADCSPDPHWLANILAAFRAHPEAAVISGRTSYGGRTTGQRVHALLSRSYLDTVHEGPTPFISANNAAWKRVVYLDHSLPTDSGPFATRIQSESVRRAGGELRFDPAIFAVHEFDGWGQEADIRRNTGFGTVISRLRDPRLPYARLIRMGRAAIPFVAAGKTLSVWRDCLRCWRVFGLRGHELPLAMALAPVLIGLETGGMWAAYGNGSVGGSAFR